MGENPGFGPARNVRLTLTNGRNGKANMDIKAVNRVNGKANFLKRAGSYTSMFLSEHLLRVRVLDSKEGQKSMMDL